MFLFDPCFPMQKALSPLRTNFLLLHYHIIGRILKPDTVLNCGVGEDSWESLGQQADQASQSSRKSALNIHWKDWCWSWSSNHLDTWYKELTHLKKLWCWERLNAGEGDDRGWDGWMTSPTGWTWIWASSGSRWWTGKPDVLQSMGHKESDKTEWLNWTELDCKEINPVNSRWIRWGSRWKGFQDVGDISIPVADVCMLTYGKKKGNIEK